MTQLQYIEDSEPVVEALEGESRSVAGIFCQCGPD